MANYTVYHLHSDLSNAVTNIDSVTKYKLYIDRASECGMSALAFSEHGSVMEWWHKKCDIEAAGMKYIHACEMYITATLDEKIRDNMHCVLIARNLDGVYELNRLVSKSFTRTDNHFYYVPRISMDELFTVSENIIITSACIGGVIYKSEGEQLDRFVKYFADHKDRCFFEIGHHMDEKQVNHNRYLHFLAKQTGVPLIAGTDTHCLNDEHVKGRQILQQSKKIYFENEDSWDLRFKTYDELVESYRIQDSLPADVYLDAIENTNRLADMIEPFEISKCTKYPKIYEDPSGTFRKKIYDSVEAHPYLTQRYSREELQQTLDEEIAVYETCQSVDFMLMQTYLREWEHAHDIWCGPGRGSVSGSLVAYALGVTGMDSKKFGLNFFRFMNPSRVTNCDIDTDYGGADRDRVKEFLLKDHMDLPQIHTSEIITFNTIALKGAIRDVCRAVYRDEDEEIATGEKPKYLRIADDICKRVEGHEDELRRQYPEVFEYVDIVNGTIVSVGTHPSGVLVSDYDIESVVGMCSTAQSPYPVSMLNMKELDDLMFVKLDILGLDNILVINETCQLAGIERLTPDNVDLEDMDVWRSIRDDTTGIFQWSSNSAQQYIRKFMSDSTLEVARQKIPNFSMLKWMSFGNGLLRPACSSYRDEVAEGKFADNGFKELNDFLAPEAGRVCMQETIMMFLVKFCGYSQAESDTVRRCVDENTLVMMGDGSWKRIKEIQVGDIVQSYDDIVSAPQKVTNVFDNGAKECFELTVSNCHSIIATNEHKFLTQRGWVELKNLTENDFVMVPKRIHATNDRLKPSYHLSCGEMFAIGAMIGDGCTCTHNLHFTNSDRDLIERVKWGLSQRTGLHGECRFAEKSQDGVTVDKVYRVSIASPNYAVSWKALFRKYGMNVPAADKHIPDALMAYPAGLKIQYLLAGLFSTDGAYVTSASAIEYCSISLRLCQDIRSLLLKYGIFSYILKKKVRDYGYYSYCLRIGGEESMKLFLENVGPYMAGEKCAKFRQMYEKRASQCNTYNYILPNECKNEFLDYCNKSGVSILSVGKKSERNTKALGVHRHDFGISDTKARALMPFAYMPLTYRLLNAEYIPMRVIDVKACGVKHVYDIEVDKTHNYVADGMIVHNCIAKKKGTETLLPEIEKRFIEYSSTHYDITAKRCAEVIKPFLQIILDASSYGFSWNHSDAYSAIGYICGYLRYYYPYEFITAALNAFGDDEEQLKKITAYAEEHNIRIMPAKYGVSRDQYYFSKERGMIAKGLESVKYLNKEVSNGLFDLSQRLKTTSFMELLQHLETEVRIDSRQLETLLKIDFFSEFGNSVELFRMLDMFRFFGCGQAKSIKKDKLNPQLTEIVAKYATDKGVKGNELKSFTITDMDGLLREIESVVRNLHLPELPYRVRAENQKEILGYVDLTTGREEDRRKLFILDIYGLRNKWNPNAKEPWLYKVTTKSIGSGKTATLSVRPGLIKRKNIVKGDIITAPKLQKDPKWGWNLLDYEILV